MPRNLMQMLNTPALRDTLLEKSLTLRLGGMPCCHLVQSKRRWCVPIWRTLAMGVLLQRIRRALLMRPERCPRRAAWGVVAIALFTVVCVVGAGFPTSPAVSSKSNSETDPAESNGKTSSHAWRLLRERNIGPLLYGLPQQLRKIAALSPWTGTVWTGVDDGGSVELDLEVEEEIPGEILIGFFRDAIWSEPPAQLRAFPRPGRYRVQRLPTGSYRVGAVVGSLPEPDAIGVHRSWPQPVTVERGETVKVQVCASSEFKVALHGSMYNAEIASGFAGTWKEIPPERLVEGRVVIPGCRRIPYCIVEAHQSKESYVPAYAGVDEGGHFRLEVPSWPRHLYASWSEPLSSLLGYRTYCLLKEESLRGPQKVDFHLEPFRTGTATVRGRAVDQDGNPVREFYLWATTPEVASARDDTGIKYYSFTNYRVPFISEEGAFELGNLPLGVYELQVMPINSRAYVPFAHKQEVKLKDGQTLEVTLKVKAKNTFYGNVLAPGGLPEGTTICLSLSSGFRASVLGAADSKGHFAIHLSDKEAEDLGAGSAFLLVSLQKGKKSDSVGRMPFELLSRDPASAGTWRLPSVKSGAEANVKDKSFPP